MKSEVIDPVDYVFEKLAATYGAAWDRALGQAPIVDVKTVWADCLSSFLHSDDAKRAILWALKNLPERVVNAIEFRNLCRMAPARQNQEVLPAPAAVRDVVAHAFKLAKPDTESRTPRVMGLVQAKAFVLRIAKRERPVIESSWRMCASV